MIPTRRECEWLVGLTPVHLSRTSVFGRREREFVDSDSIVVVHDGLPVLGHTDDEEHKSLEVCVVEIIHHTINSLRYRPARIRTPDPQWARWLRGASSLADIEIIADPDLDLYAIVDANPPWRLRVSEGDLALLGRLHACAAWLREASSACVAAGPLEFGFELPTIGLAGLGRLERELPGFESLELGDFELDPRITLPIEEAWVNADAVELLRKSIELYQLSEAEAPELLLRERAAHVGEGEPYPILECERNRDMLCDAGRRELRIVSLVAQGLLAFVHEQGRALRTRARLRGEYDARWGEEVFTVRIIRPQRTLLSRFLS